MRSNPFLKRPRIVRLAATVAILGLWCCATLTSAQESPNEPDTPTEIVIDTVEPALPIAPKAAIVTIHEDIDDVTVASLERRAEQAIADGANIIVIELDTPGGMVSSSVDIVKYLRNLSDNRGVRTIAWVRDEAISGGTMISMACDEIIMSRSSTIGDCGVIMMGPGGVSTAQDPALDAKIDSYVLSVFDGAVTRNGYDQLLCDSFVRYEIEVWWLENSANGERQFVSTSDKDKMLGKRTESGWSTTLKDRGQSGRWTLVETYVDPRDDQVKKLRQPIVSDTKLLTMDQSLASTLGFCKALVRDEGELKTYCGMPADAELARFDENWSETLVSWMTSPMVRMILIALIGMGAYAEFQTPGLGLPGLVSVVALTVFLGAPYITGLANVWEIVVIFLGVALILTEVLLIPGFGVAGISGMVLLIVGLLATFMPEDPSKMPIYWPEMPQSFEGLKTGVKTLAGGLVLCVAGMIVLSRYLSQIPYLKDVVPANPTAKAVIIDDPYDGLADIGDIGRCESPLRPSGKARFGSKLVDVVTEGEMLDVGAVVEVIERKGNRVVVRKNA